MFHSRQQNPPENKSCYPSQGGSLGKMLCVAQVAPSQRGCLRVKSGSEQKSNEDKRPETFCHEESLKGLIVSFRGETDEKGLEKSLRTHASSGKERLGLYIL